MANEIIKILNIKKVLETAVSCFMQHGIESTTFALIAKNSGVSLRGVQRYYGVKSELVQAALEYFIDNTFNDMEKEFSCHCTESITGYARLLEYFKIQQNFLLKNPRTMILMSEMEIYCYKNCGATQAFQKHDEQLKKIRRYITELLNDGVKDGSVRPDINPEFAGEMISMSFSGMMQKIAILLPCDEEELERYILQIFQEYGNMLNRYLK